MEIPVEAWYEAIFYRRSRRKFQAIRLQKDKLIQLSSVCHNFRPFPEARAVLVDDLDGRIYRGFLGSYGKIENAPAYIAFIGDMGSPRVKEAVGYTGEGIILEATSLGIGTCWVGGYFYPEAAADQISIESNEKILAVTPIGIPKESFTFQEKLMTGFGRLHKRKLLGELVTQKPRQEWMQLALNAARLAPSAVNRQPWRFFLSDNAISIALDNKKDTYKISRRLDCGIAMLHLELGARHAGVMGKWSFSQDYIATYTVDPEI